MMENEFRIISPEQIPENTFKLIEKDWMLLTAGTLQEYNTMTASWGGFGVMWGKSVCFCVVRPQRYTYEFMEAAENFTLSFFDENYRDMLSFCGANSGRDVDKAAATGITPVEVNPGRVYFNEARLVMECRKIYYHDINPANFIATEIEKNYPNRDYHRMYIGEIEKCYMKS